MRTCSAPPEPQAKTPQFKRDYPTWSNVERIVAPVATQNGRRVKPRYIGVANNRTWLRTRCAALNLAPCSGTASAG